MLKNNDYFNSVLNKNNSYSYSKFRTFHLLAKTVILLTTRFSGRKIFPYRAVIADNIAFLVATEVHNKELNYWQFKIDSEFFPKLSVLDAIKIKIVVIVECIINPKRIFAILFSKNPTSKVFDLLTLIYNFHCFLAYKRGIEAIDQRTTVSGFGCFELGNVGLAVSEYCKISKKKSIFVQHGLFDSFLTPIFFDSYRIWNKWDEEFLQITPKNEVRLKYDFSKLETSKPANSNKILFLALDYPTIHLFSKNLEESLQQIKQSADSIGWHLIVRPHPRDKLGWLKNFTDYKFDPFRELSITESFKKNNASAFLAFNSAALLEIRNLGISCMYIKNPLTQHILAPMRQIAIEITDPKTISQVLEKL